MTLQRIGFGHRACAGDAPARAACGVKWATRAAPIGAGLRLVGTIGLRADAGAGIVYS